MAAEPSAETRPSGIGIFVRLTWYSASSALKAKPSVVFFAAIVWAGAAYTVGFFTPLLAALPQKGWLMTNVVWLGGTAIWLATLIVQNAALAYIAVAVHRLVIVNDTGTGGLFERPLAVYIGWLFVFNLAAAIVPFVNALVGVKGVGLLSAAVGVALLFLALRCSLLFPAVATEVPAASLKERLETSWAQSRGQFWRLFLVALLALLPVVIAGLLVRGAFAHFPSGAAILPFVQPLELVLTATVAMIEAAVGAAAVSWVYLWALDHPQPEPEADATSLPR